MRLLKQDPFTGFLVISFVALQIALLTTEDALKPIITPDSGTYRIAESPWLSFEAVLAGKRPLLITFWYSIWPSDGVRVITQTILFAFCWAMLLISVSLLIKSKYIKPLATTSFWLLGFSPLVFQWTVLILSESLTISLLVLSLAALFGWLATKHSSLLYSSAVFLTAAALIRPQLFIVVALTAVFWVIGGRRLVTKRTPYLVGSALLALGVLLSIAQQVWNDRNFSEDQLVGRTTWIYTNALLPNSPFADRIIDALPAETPACIVPKEPLGDTAGQFLIEEYRVDCPEGLRWIQDNFQSVYLTFLLSDPAATARDTALLLWDSATVYAYGPAASLGPPNDLVSLVALQESRYFLVFGLVATITAMVAWPRIKRSERKKMVVLALLGGFFFVSWVGALLLQIADFHRTSVTSIVPINVLLLAIFLLAIDGMAQRENLTGQTKSGSNII